MFERDILNTELEVLNLSDQEQLLTKRKPKAPPVTIFNNKPSYENRLVINTRELNISPALKIINWGKPGSNHNTKVKARSRKREQIFQLAIHETATPLSLEDKANGYGPKPDDYASAHLSVKRNGTVLQFNDLYQNLNHVGVFNDAGIGIEFVNRSWLGKKDGAEAYECLMTDVAKKSFPRGDDFLYSFWGSGFNIYRIPPSIDQLETMVNMIRFFIIDLPEAINNFKTIGPAHDRAVNTIARWLSVFPEDVAESVVNELCPIDRNWINIIARKNVPADWLLLDKGTNSLPSDQEKNDRNLFVFTKAYGLFNKGNKIDSVKVENLRGVYPHGAFVTGSAHNDGNFIVLYAWLRIEKNYAPQEALHICKVLMERHYIRFDRVYGTKIVDGKEVDLKNRIVVLDVRNATLSQALTEVYPNPSPPWKDKKCPK